MKFSGSLFAFFFSSALCAPLTTMHISPEGIAALKHSEGFVGVFYNDILADRTIGYGHACHGDGNNCAGITSPLSEQQAHELLLRDLPPREDCVRQTITTDITNNMFDSLVSIVFNAGCEAFKSSPIPSLVNNRQFAQAAEVMKTQCTIKTTHLDEICIRRQREAAHFCAGGGCEGNEPNPPPQTPPQQQPESNPSDQNNNQPLTNSEQKDNGAQPNQDNPNHAESGNPQLQGWTDEQQKWLAQQQKWIEDQQNVINQQNHS